MRGAQTSLYPFRNLKKMEESILRTEKEMEETEEEIKKLMEDLTVLEDQAAKVLSERKQAEVSVPFTWGGLSTEDVVCGTSCG